MFVDTSCHCIGAWKTKYHATEKIALMKSQRGTLFTLANQKQDKPNQEIDRWPKHRLPDATIGCLERTEGVVEHISNL